MICGKPVLNNKRYCYNCGIKHRRNYVGSNNPRWKGGTSVGYLLRICTEVLIKDNRNLTHCEECNKEGKISMKGKLDIHHKDKNRNNNIASNLMVVCRHCHKILDVPPVYHKVNCSNCNNELIRNESNFKHNKRFYCTKQCYYEMLGKKDYRKKVRVGGLVW